MSNFNNDFKFSKETIPLWKKYMQEIHGDSLYKINDYETDMPLQKSGWDIELVFSGYQKPLRCEIKTRKQNCIPFFKIYQDVLIEIQGNIELNKTGSGIRNSKADLWCYGWYDVYNIFNPLIYYKDKLWDWVKYNQHKYTKKITNGTEIGNGDVYHTKFITVKCKDIEHLLYDPKFVNFNDSKQTKLF